MKSLNEFFVFAFKFEGKWRIETLVVYFENDIFKVADGGLVLCEFSMKFFPRQFLPTLIFSYWLSRHSITVCDFDTLKFLEMPVSFGSYEKKEDK